MTHNKQRAAVSTYVSAIIVLSFIAVGFLVMFAALFLGKEIKPPGEWLAAMLSLASTALGFLAGETIQKKKDVDLFRDQCEKCKK